MPLASFAGLLSLSLLTSTVDAAERPPLPPCEAGDVRLEVDADAPPGVSALCITPDLTSNFLFDTKLARVEFLGVAFKRLTDSLKTRPRAALALMEAWSYRAGNEKKGRVAVELELKNPGTKPWTLTGAVLRGAKREELTPLPEDTPVSILPGLSGRVMVELEATTKQAQGAYTLTLLPSRGAQV